MADFEKWIAAAEPALTGTEWKAGDFQTAYNENRKNATNISMEAVPWLGALQDFLHTRKGKWEGTATELLSEVTQRAQDERWVANWPKTGRSLANGLRRLRPNLRNLGIEVDFKRDKHRMITIRQRPASGSPSLIEAD
jgi:hypothetical protein